VGGSDVRASGGLVGPNDPALASSWSTAARTPSCGPPRQTDQRTEHVANCVGARHCWSAPTAGTRTSAAGRRPGYAMLRRASSSPARTVGWGGHTNLRERTSSGSGTPGRTRTPLQGRSRHRVVDGRPSPTRPARRCRSSARRAAELSRPARSMGAELSERRARVRRSTARVPPR